MSYPDANCSSSIMIIHFCACDPIASPTCHHSDVCCQNNMACTCSAIQILHNAPLDRFVAIRGSQSHLREKSFRKITKLVSLLVTERYQNHSTPTAVVTTLLRSFYLLTFALCIIAATISSSIKEGATLRRLYVLFSNL